jgi:DNA mismatch repair ATPase MutS
MERVVGGGAPAPRSPARELSSRGIQVARLAGLPLSVIDRAKTILAKLESDDTSVSLPAPAGEAEEENHHRTCGRFAARQSERRVSQ